MQLNRWKCSWMQVACLSFCSVLAWAQSSNAARNLAECRAGNNACDSSKLSPADLEATSTARHERNVFDCRNGFTSCDRSKLTEPEAISIAVAQHQRNVSDCKDSMSSCDRSKLTASEAREVGVSEHQRNLADCKDGVVDVIVRNLRRQRSFPQTKQNANSTSRTAKAVLASVIIPS
jgi:hypothetical protein